MLASRAVAPRCGARCRAQGFTLIELLVALLIVGVVAGLVGLSVGSADRSLQFDAERLAQVLSLAREEAQVRGAPIRLDADDRGYRFVIRRASRWAPILDDNDLRARAWSAPTRLAMQRADGGALVEFGRDMVDVPFTLVLRRDGREAVIDANGLGSFELR